MSRYISGRYKKTPQSALPADRYRYLSPGDAEPNLGDTPGAQGSPNLPAGQQYILVGFIDRPGERFWIPNQGGIIPGSITIFEEGTRVGGLSSTTQLDFRGKAITAVGDGTNTTNPGVAVTITVAPPGNESEVLFVGSGGTDFATDLKFTFDSGLLAAGDRITVGTGGTVITTTLNGLVGIGTTDPTQELHLDGDFRITGTIYDSLNNPGNQGDLLVKTATGDLIWVSPKQVISGAGGTIGQIQYHNAAGLVDGAENFYFDYVNNRVGIGSTQPKELLDVLGVSTFSGGVNVDTLTAFENSTFKKNLDVDQKLTVDGLADLDEVNVSGASTFTGVIDANGDLDVDGHTELDNLGVSGIATFSNELQVDATGTFKVIGDGSGQDVILASAGGITTTGGDAYIGGDLYIKDDLFFNHLTAKTGEFTESLKVTGIFTATSYADIANVRITGNTVKSTKIGDNLVLQSDHGIVQTNDALYVNSNIDSNDKDSGALVVNGGVGIENNLNVGGAVSFTGPSVGVAVTLAAAGGITTTGGDLYVGGDLYIKDDLFFDDLSGDDMVISGIATINQLEIGKQNQTLVGITTILDEDDMVSDRNDALATQQSIKAYIDNVELEFSGDIGIGTVTLDTQTFTISGTSNEIETSAANQTLTIGLPDDVTVSGNLTVNGNTTLGNDVNSDTVSFGSTISSSFIPNTDNSYDIGSTNNRWSTVYSETFNGAFQGTADDAEKLTTPRNISFSEDVVAVAKTFDGQSSVGFALTLTDTGVISGTYGSSTQVGIVTVDSKGRVTAASNVNINFADATVDIAKKLETPRNISFSEDVVAVAKTFDGQSSVGFALTLTDIVTSGTVGSSTQVGIVTFDAKGRITAASNVDINFADATVGKAGYADNAGIATNLKGGQAYNIPYQSNVDETSFIANGSITGQLLQYNQSSAPSWVNATGLTVGIANSLSGGAAGSIPYQTGPGITSFLDEPNADGYVLHYNNNGDAPEWKELSTFAGVGYTIEAADDGDNAKIVITDGGTGISSITVTAGSNITIDPADSSGFTIAAVAGAGIGIAASATDILNVNNAQIGGVDAGADKIVFYDESEEKLTYLNVGTGLTISGNTITANEDAGKTYTLPVTGVLGGNQVGVVTWTLSDGTTDDPVTLKAGAGVTITAISNDEFTIAVDTASGDIALDKITENNTSAEVVDTGGDGHFKVITDGTERLRVMPSGFVGIGTTNSQVSAQLDVQSDGLPASIKVNKDSSDLIYLSNNNITNVIGGDQGALYFKTNGTAGSDERLRIGPVGQIGIAGANYGTPGQVLTSNGTGAGVSWSDASSIGAGTTDKISEADSKAEIIDTATEQKFTVHVNNVERFSVDAASTRIHRQNNTEEGGSLVFNRAADDVAAFELDVYGSSTTGSGRFRIIDATGPNGGTERFAIGPNGEIGLGYVGVNNAFYGTAGQVLTSGGAGAGVTWADAPSGGGTGTLTDIDVKQFSDNNTPRTEYGCSNPIDVTVAAGIATIGIGTTSNAYGKRYIGSTEPTVDVCDGDIWYDTSTGSGNASFTSDPVGTIIAWAGTVANIPAGYQLCDGTQVQSLELQNIVGSNVPDLRSRFIVGANDVTGEGTWPSVGVGSTGGSANSVVASHSHGTYGNESGYRHAVRHGSDAGIDWDSHTAHVHDATYNANSRTDTSGVDSDGNSDSSQTGTNANLPPYYALCYIIKHGASNTILSGAVDKISEGTTEAEVVDLGTNGHFKVTTDGTEKLRILSDGSVGIGTTAPEATLDVRGKFRIETTNSLDITLNGSVTGADASRVQRGQYNNTSGNGMFPFTMENSTRTAGLHFFDGDIQRASVNASQYSGGFALVGRNSTYDYADNHISAMPSIGMRIGYSAGSFQLNKTANFGQSIHTSILEIESTNDNLIFSGGDVGLGTITPTAKLDVNGTVAIGSSVYDSNGNTGSDGQVLSSVPGIGVSWTDQTGGSGNSGSSGGTTKVAVLSDVKPSGTAGGTFNSGSWIDRTLNTELDPESFVTFNSSNNYFALESGTYKINWSAPAYNTGEHKTQLVHANNTSFTSPTNIQGSSEFDSSGIEPNTQTRSFGETVVTITETTYFKLQHRCAANQNSNGLGIESNFSVDEVYSQIVVQDLSSGGGSSSSGGGGGEPVGTIVAWSGTVANIPTGYQLCDGLEAQTSALSAITGAYVPDLRSRFIVGAHDVTGEGTWPSVGVGSTGGSADATLVQHSHTTNSTIEEGSANAKSLTGSFKNENHSGGTGNYATGIFNVTDFSNGHNEDSSQGTGGPIVNIDATHRHATDSQGDPATNANLPPYYALCYIIKHTAGSSSSGGSSGDKISEGNTEAEVVDTNGNGHFKVTTEGTERLRVTSNGSVGIGTTNPEGSQNSNPLFATKLDVFKSFVGGGDGSFVGRFYGLDTNVQETSVRFITKGTGGTAADLHNASDAYLMHGISNGDTKFVFGSNGSVGIGSTLPKAKLDVNGTVAIGSSIYDSNGNLGSDGQVLSSVPGIGVSWTDQTGGSSSSSSGGSGFVLLERKSATGTSVEFTGIPADAYEITLMFEGVSGSTATDFDVQLGTSSGYITSNYNSSSEKANGENSSNSTSSFVIRNDDASSSFQGSMIINKSSSNSYSEIGQFKNSSITACETFGSLSSVSGVVDRLKVSIGNGNFDAGLIGLSYKTASSGNSGSSGGGGEPVGTIVAWSGTASNIPTGYQLCDGGSAQTSALQAITGANVPDLTDKFIVGADSSGDTTYPGLSPGATGGSANAVLIAHSHCYNRANSRCVSDGGVVGAEVLNNNCLNTSTVGQDNAGNASNTQTGTNANLPPYYSLCYIIKHTATSGSGGSSGDKISEGTAEAEVVDLGTSSAEDNYFKVTTDGTEKLRVTRDGRVGIGSTQPTGVLDLNSTTGDANVIIRTFSNNLGNTQVIFGDTDNHDTGKVQYNHPENFLAFHTNGSEQVRIDSSGSVGIGTTLPDDPVTSSNTAKLAVGIVTCHELYVNGTQITGSGGSSDPVGTIVAWAGSVASIPSEYQLCDGSLAPESLQSIVGTYVPDLRSRFIIGADADATINGVVLPTTSVTGSATTTGGSEDATLPTHSHTINYYGADDESGGPIRFAPRFDRDEADATPGTITTNSQGSSATNANLPPYYALCYIIKHTATSGSSSSSGGGSLVKLATVATNSGTEAAFTNIPSTAKKITVAIHNFGYSGANDELIMHVGDSTGYYTSTNDYQSSYDAKDNQPDAQSKTNYYGLSDDTNNGLEQNITVELVNVTGNSWTISHQGAASILEGRVIHGGGSISLTNALDRLRIKTANGRILDHGHVTVYYETASDAPAANTVSSDAIVLQTAKTATGSSVEFTDIPEDAYEITLMFNGVSLSGTNNFKIQLGTSSNYIVSNYESLSQTEGGGDEGTSDNGFIIRSTSGGHTHTGSMLIKKASSTSYIQTGQFATGPNTGNSPVEGGTQTYGSLSSVSGTVNRLRVILSGTNTFDAGSFSLSYKTPGSANNEGTDAGQGFFVNDTTLNSSKILPANKNVGIFGPYTIGDNVTLTVPTGTTFTVV